MKRPMRGRGLRWGSAALPRTPVQLDVQPLSEGGAGRIGLGVLRGYNIHMDARAGRMVLSPCRTPPPPASITRAGVQGVTTAAGRQVVPVMKGSPARAAGLRPGDRICKADGVALVPRTGPGWGEGAAGRTVRLDLCDGRTLPLTPAELY